MNFLKNELKHKGFYPFVFLFSLLIASAIFQSCEQSNIFSDKDDVELGEQFDKEIKANPKEFPMLQGHQDIKDYVTSMGKEILNSPKIKKRSIYPYQFQVIDDTIINAFCTPGGYVYIYTGLMKFLDNESGLAGVVGHEIAHAERRHVTQRLTAYYGVSMLLGFILGGNPSMLAEIAANLFVGLAFLKNSRDDETEADYYSIQYLKSTKWYPGGITFFFDKIKEEQRKKGTTPGDLDRLLSTHPLPNDRISFVNKELGKMNPKPDPTKGLYTDEYQAMKQKLPSR
ncbi:MAG TPA: M48 family metallopeptidase [Ignavibacteria bacterium]|nr:peptidase M48 [Bacteroidota bacterium]HRE11979.1 M48 family metallopeptidase [Ignavibacteria bacterium]HRF65789.1 M48 family metallopeptidase [Ignavibacteria bacterium]HRJ03241.1 M48 family metallopeptidase [Ignavibacteria bacterium]HRJ85166.1 M48 family metallopeptidase [Ignavibacteria bacterium]